MKRKVKLVIDGNLHLHSRNSFSEGLVLDHWIKDPEEYDESEAAVIRGDVIIPDQLTVFGLVLVKGHVFTYNTEFKINPIIEDRRCF